MTFKPLLAATCEDIAGLRYPVLASPKLDGIRCVIRGGKALSRKLKPIPNDFVRNWLEANAPDGLDGELMLRDHRAPFKEVSSAIMSKDGEPDFVYRVFDHVEESDMGFQLRHNNVIDALERNFEIRNCTDFEWTRRLRVVPHKLISDEVSLRGEVGIHQLQGYEGTMVRSPEGRYKFGRSTVKEGILLKIKAFVDEEATVVDVIEQMHNTNEAEVDNLGHTKRSSAKAGKVGAGAVGALQCVTEDGAEFEIGTFKGVTKEELAEWWISTTPDGAPGSALIGRQVKFKHQPDPGGRQPGQAPRFPVFLGWRED